MHLSEELSINELASNLSTYKEQLQQVRRFLLDDPGNTEYVDMEKELEEVIVLTDELLNTARQNKLAGLKIESTSSDTLDEESSFPVGAKVQAVWSDDGEWYNATVEGHTPNGYFVCYDDWGNREEVDPYNVRPCHGSNALEDAEKDAEATKQAIKRKIAMAASVEFQARILPNKLRIEPNDPDDVKAAKRKKIHAFKSKSRLEHLEIVQNKKQNAWHQFQTTKGHAKKIGFFSGRKRESIFKSPDDPNGRVGVTGSGKGLTEFQKREKHLHLKGSTVEMDE